MRVDSQGIRAILADIDTATEAVKNAEAIQRSINNIGMHQNPITVRVANRAFEVTEMDRYCNQTTRRGYEMVMLGLQKVTNAEVDKCKAELERLVIKLKEFTNEQSTASV